MKEVCYHKPRSGYRNAEKLAMAAVPIWVKRNELASIRMHRSPGNP